MSTLIGYLGQLEAGPVEKHETREAIEQRLSALWADLEGANEGGMQARKLIGRTSAMEWMPPVLTFKIERHGAIVVGGSGYAEVQTWSVDLESGTAALADSRKRRVRPTQPPFDAKPMAEVLAKAILDRGNDPRLRWTKDGRVQVRMNGVLPPGSKQTTQGRRKRLNGELKRLLDPHGWSRGPGGWWTNL